MSGTGRILRDSELDGAEDIKYLPFRNEHNAFVSYAKIVFASPVIMSKFSWLLKKHTEFC